MFIERMREEFPPGACEGAVLQRGVPGASAAVVTMEEPAAVPAVGEWPGETPATKRTLPATSHEISRPVARRRHARVITIKAGENIFSAIGVIVRAAMRGLNRPGDRRCSGSARSSAGAHWNGFWSGSGVGWRGVPEGAVVLGVAAEPQAGPHRCGDERCGERLAILSCLKVQLRFGMPRRGKGDRESNPRGCFRFLFFRIERGKEPACCTGLEKNRKN